MIFIIIATYQICAADQRPALPFQLFSAENRRKVLIPFFHLLYLLSFSIVSIKSHLSSILLLFIFSPSSMENPFVLSPFYHLFTCFSLWFVQSLMLICPERVSCFHHWPLFALFTTCEWWIKQIRGNDENNHRRFPLGRSTRIVYFPHPHSQVISGSRRWL